MGQMNELARPECKPEKGRTKIFFEFKKKQLFLVLPGEIQCNSPCAPPVPAPEESDQVHSTLRSLTTSNQAINIPALYPKRMCPCHNVSTSLSTHTDHLIPPALREVAMLGGCQGQSPILRGAK